MTYSTRLLNDSIHNKKIIEPKDPCERFSLRKGAWLPRNNIQDYPPFFMYIYTPVRAHTLMQMHWNTHIYVSMCAYLNIQVCTQSILLCVHTCIFKFIILVFKVYPRLENICIHKNLCLDVYSTVIHKEQNNLTI